MASGTASLSLASTSAGSQFMSDQLSQLLEAMLSKSYSGEE